MKLRNREFFSSASTEWKWSTVFTPLHLAIVHPTPINGFFVRTRFFLFASLSLVYEQSSAESTFVFVCARLSSCTMLYMCDVCAHSVWMWCLCDAWLCGMWASSMSIYVVIVASFVFSVWYRYADVNNACVSLPHRGRCRISISEQVSERQCTLSLSLISGMLCGKTEPTQIIRIYLIFID